MQGTSVMRMSRFLKEKHTNSLKVIEARKGKSLCKNLAAELNQVIWS